MIHTHVGNLSYQLKEEIPNQQQQRGLFSLKNATVCTDLKCRSRNVIGLIPIV